MHQYLRIAAGVQCIKYHGIQDKRSGFGVVIEIIIKDAGDF